MMKQIDDRTASQDEGLFGDVVLQLDIGRFQVDIEFACCGVGARIPRDAKYR